MKKLISILLLTIIISTPLSAMAGGPSGGYLNPYNILKTPGPDGRTPVKVGVDTFNWIKNIFA